MYEIEGLKEGIEQEKKNIAIFEEAIDKANATIKDYRRMILVLERKEQEQKLAQSRVEFEVEN